MNPFSNFNAGMVEATLKGLTETLQKAGVSTTDVTGLGLTREDLSPILALMVPTDTPVRNRLRRIGGNGPAHAWYQQIAQADTDGSLFFGTTPSGAAFAAGGLPVKTASKYRRVSAPFVQLGDQVNVTIFDQAAGRSYSDLLQHETDVALMNTALCEEWMTINGDSSVNPLYYDGLLKQVNTNIVDAGGVQFKLSHIASAQQKVYDLGGMTRMNVMSTRMKRKVNDLIVASYYGIRQMTSVAGANMFGGGINVKSWDFGYGDTDLIQSRYMQPGAGTSGGTTETILCLDEQSSGKDGNAIEMVDLLPVSLFDLGMITSSHQKLVMEISVLKLTSPNFQGKVTNLAAPTYNT
jgi:hypothetical protein